METCQLGGGAANGLPAAGLVPGVVPSGPVLDHSAQKDKRLLAQQGSLGKRRKPSRGSLHSFLSALHRWEPGADQEDPQLLGEATVPAVSADVTGSAPPPAAHSASPLGGPAARSRPPPLSTDIDNVNEEDSKPKSNRTNQQTEINNNNNNNNNSKNAQIDPKPGVRFISASKEEGSESTQRLDVPKKEDVVRAVLGHRRQSSLDSGCSLDMSSSSSSGKGSPDPVAPTLTPPPEFADTPIMERRRRSRRRQTSGPSATSGTMAVSPGVGRETCAGTYTAVTKVPESIPRIPRAKESSTAKTASPDIQINFRILPRAKARTTNGPGTPVSRSESCRTYSKTAGDVVAPAFKTMSWDRHVLSSPSDRYLDDSERRCRSLSRPARPPSPSSLEDARRDPEWLEIARRRQATGVDWENLEARMKQPHSISCSNLSESHLRGKVSSLESAERAGMRLVRSASALYPRIKMSRFERRLRRENPNPSPERRRSSDEFVVVSSSSSDAASAGASSTEDEKPSFLNVQLRHVEKAPPLNVVFQTRGGAGGVAATATAAELAGPRSASPTLTWKSHREDTIVAGTPSSARLGAASSRDRATGGAGRARTASESLDVAEYLTPKRIELIEATPPAKKEDAAAARRSPTRTTLSDHVSRGLGKVGPPLRRSSSVQMRSREVMSAGRASPWDQVDSAITPSWILEAERKKKSGIDWARLDKSLSQSGGRRSANLSSECLHQPTSATEVVPDWLKEIRRKKEEDASIRLSRSSGCSPGATGSRCEMVDGSLARTPTDMIRLMPDQFAADSLEEEATHDSLVVRGNDPFSPQDCVFGDSSSPDEDDLPCAVLLESLSIGGTDVEGGGGGLRAPSSRREDSVGWPENLSALLDEIFSEAEESCTTPFPVLPPPGEQPVAPPRRHSSGESDDRGDGEIYVNVVAPRDERHEYLEERDQKAARAQAEDVSKPMSPLVTREVAQSDETVGFETRSDEAVPSTTTATIVSTTVASAVPATTTVVTVRAVESHSPKQALMEELKHVLLKRNSLEHLREDILNEATVIDSATPRPQARSPTDASRKTPPAVQKPTEPTTEAIAGPTIPPPPPMPPSDFWSKPKEVWFKKQLEKPEAGRIVAPVCQRDSETQTLEYGTRGTSPVQAFSPGSLLHAISPFATYTHPFVAPGGNQVLFLDDRGVQLPSRQLYAVPPAAGVFPGAAAILVARDDDRVPKKVAMESKATSTEDHAVPPPSPAAAASVAEGDTKSMLDEVEKKLEEDRKPPDETRPRTATPAGLSKITTVETTTIMETIESTKVSRRAIDETSLKSICSRSEKEDVLSGLSDSPIPFADDDDVLEELGYSSHIESRSASRAEEKKEELVSDEKVTMYSSTRKNSSPQTEPKEPIEVRGVKSPPAKKQVSVAEQRAAATPSPVPSPPRAGTPLRSQVKAPMVNGYRSPPLETSFDVVDRGFHTEPLKKKGSSGVTVLSSSKGESVTSKFQRPSCISPSSSSTVTTGPDGTLRGAHARTTAQTLAAATKEYCNGDVRSPLGPFKKTKSMSDSNLGPRTRPTKKAMASQATQTPNGVLPAPSYERRYFEGGFGGRAMGVQTDDRIESFLRDTMRTSTKEVEFVTKVDSSQPSKTLRKKVTTKIMRGSSSKGGGVREIIEEIYDQSSVVVRPSTAIKNVTRSVQQTSDGQKYLTTVITEAPAAGRSRRSRRRGFGDPDTHIIMV